MQLLASKSSAGAVVPAPFADPPAKKRRRVAKIAQADSDASAQVVEGYFTLAPELAMVLCAPRCAFVGVSRYDA